MNQRYKVLILIVVYVSFVFRGFTQDSVQTDFSNKRFKTLILSASGLYGASLVGMNELWYKNQPRNAFHFFNDNAEWLQMDKVGHFYWAYQMSDIGVKAFQWSGIDNNKAYFYGMLVGIIYQTPIEILDGFSPAFGASWGDLLANATGSAFLYMQYRLWDQIKIRPKFSFSRSEIAPLRPDVLGATFMEQVLKDYNGQTYWFSANIRLLTNFERIPPWLSLSVGYGANDMLRAREVQNSAEGHQMYRQCLFSLDVDWTQVKTKRKFVKWLLHAANFIKIPFPAIEINAKKGLVLHPMYF